MALSRLYVCDPEKCFRWRPESPYPALHRLERQSWVQSEWKQSESKKRARYYRITAMGKKQLASDLGRWERIVEAIGSVMYVKPEESEVMKWFPGFGFQRRKRELQEEIDAHLQMAIADRVARGETAEAARQAAVREFGNIPLVQDVTRQMWGRNWLGQLGRGVRYALRQLRRSPGFTITATAMLAVAICANSTVFSWIDGTMLRPIPGARDAGDLVSLQRGERNFSPTPPFSYLDYRDLREQNHTFSGILAYHHDWITLTGGAQPERVYIANVSANYFDVLGIKPVLGRFFLAEEESRPDLFPTWSWVTRFGRRAMPQTLQLWASRSRSLGIL